MWWTSTYCRLIAAPDDIAIGWCYDSLSNSRYKACEHYHLDLPYEDTSGAKLSGSKQKEHTVEFTDFPPDATEDADEEDESQTQVSNSKGAGERETLRGSQGERNTEGEPGREKHWEGRRVYPTNTLRWYIDTPTLLNVKIIIIDVSQKILSSHYYQSARFFPAVICASVIHTVWH